MATSTTQSRKKEDVSQSNIEAVKYLIESENASSTNIQSIITRLNITSNSTIIDNRIKLSKYVIESLIENLTKNGTIRIDNGLYIIGGQRFDKKSLISQIATKHRSTISQRVKDLERAIKNHQQIKQLDVKIYTNKQRIVNIKVETKALQKTRDEMVKQLNTQNKQLIDMAYKQGRIQSGMRAQQARIADEKYTNITKFQQIKQNYQSQQIKHQSLIILRESQIHAANQYRAMNRDNLSRAYQKYLAAEIKHNNDKSKLALLKHRNDLSLKLLEEGKNTRRDLNRNVLDMASMVKQLGLDVRNMTFEQAKRLQQSIKDANARIQGADRTAKTGIIDALNKATIDLTTELSRNGKLAETGIDRLIAALNAQKPNLDPPKNGMPPGCAGQAVPPGCSGNAWILRTNNATRNSPQMSNIEIYQCNAEGHFCASDGLQGHWDHVKHYYTF